MRREPSLTFEGALRILGNHEPGLIGKLDNVLGGVILAAGAGAALAAVGGPVLAPLGMFAAVWGFTEQKNEALGLLRKAVNGVSGKMAGTHGYERRQLIAAAHTAIVVAAFFESFREHVGKDFYDRLEITDAEKERLISRRGEADGTIYDSLYAAEIPAPSPVRGFEENVGVVRRWVTVFTGTLEGFLRGLSAAGNTSFEWELIINGAVERYRSHFLALAAKVPEFMIWAMLGEGAATRAAVAALRADIAAALDVRPEALARVESLLAVDAPRNGTTPDLRAAVARANVGILEEAIIPEDGQAQGQGITFPTIREIYINSRYRTTSLGDVARLADEDWWDEQPLRDDFDLMLAGYVTSSDATRVPMLLLGDPGAGKSMLTKVFAARLPTLAYTVVRVPLRRVGANAPVLAQIEEALLQATNRRVESWWRLAEQSEGTVRVVLLDGLDELLQATKNDRSGYLQEVMEFQRREAEQEQPVIVVVTSRTVVADRVDVPRGTAIVKLDAFNGSDIEEWLARWRAVNATAIASGQMRELTADWVTRDAGGGTRHGEVTEQLGGRLRQLARQPLLLLMLAIYAADPTLPRLDADIVTADLYQRLLESFARREAVKDRNLRSDELETRVRDHLDRLEVAALAMFNRGRQEISEEELGADLVALGGDQMQVDRPRPVEAGQRVIAEFFFVHAAEARIVIGRSGAEADRLAGSRGERPLRSYEFLHATFGEYFVANRVMSELADVAAKAFAGRRGPAAADDDLLYALLSHQPLTARKSTLTFAQEIFEGFEHKDRESVLKVLEVLLGSYRHRHDSNRYAGYQPIPPDAVRELACYSANLVALRVILGGSVQLPDLLRIQNDGTLEQWRSTVMLWKAGLDADGMQSMLATVQLSSSQRSIDPNPESPKVALLDNFTDQSVVDEISLARLIDDHRMEHRLRYGSAIIDHLICTYNNDDWVHQMASWLIPAIAGKKVGYVIERPPEGTQPADLGIIAALIFRYFKTARADSQRDNALLRLLYDLPGDFLTDGLTLATLSSYMSDVPEDTPEPSNPDVYSKYVAMVHGITRKEKERRHDSLEEIVPRIDWAEIPDGAAQVIGALLRERTGGMQDWDFN